MLVSTKMITGFNTDVQHEGNVYHVQTEDRGKDHPIVESLVYVGGTIVAKKLTPYPEPLNEVASPEALASLLKRQHQVIIAAIKAGRIEDLIRHSLKQAANELQENASAERPVRAPQHGKLPGKHEQIGLPPRGRVIDEFLPRATKASDPAEPVRAAPAKPRRVSGQGLDSQRVNVRSSSSRGDTAGVNLDQVLDDYAKRGGGQAKLEVKVLMPEVFIAGKGIGLRVQVTHEAKPDFDATVTVKIIGTAFRPQVFIGRVGRDGVANFSLTLPSFSTGTAAIVIEAQSSTGRGELKKLIRRA